MSESTFPITVDVPPTAAVPLPSTADLQPFRYELLDEIARGGMGVVVRARDRTLNRDLAVKILHEEFVRRPDVIRRFLDEAQIAGQLQHPGIVPIHEIGRLADGRPAMAMKLVKGRTLSAIMRERPDPSHDRPRYLAIFEQICQTLAYAHSKGVIHRDLKPLNIMVGAFGEVQVMDWGLAKVLGDGSACVTPSTPDLDVTLASVIETARGRDDTQAGSALGTYSYMPPEQARGESDRLDRRCDVFGLGAVLCEILTGDPPYIGSSVAAVRRQALIGDHSDAWRRLDACGADAQLIALAKQCMQGEPEDRPRDAGAVATAISEHLAGVQERLRQADIERARAETRRIESLKRRRVLAALALAALSTIAIGIAAWIHNRDVRAAHQALTTARVNEIIGKATSFRDQARQVQLVDGNKRLEAANLWDQSLKLAAEAEKEVTAEPADPATMDRVREFAAAIRADNDVAARDLKMLGQLEAGFDLRAVISDADYDRVQPKAIAVFGRGGAKLYEASFREYGIDVAKLDAQEVAARIKKSAIRDALIAALNDWCHIESDRPEVIPRLMAACKAVDSDAFRMRLRTAVVAQDTAELKSLATDPAALELPSSTAVLLAEGLQQVGEAALAVPVFEKMQRRRPDDFWINDVLGVLLSQTDPARTAEAMAYFRAALASRPNFPVIYDNLASALEHKCQFARAKETICKAIEMSPQFVKSRMTLADILADMGHLDQAISECREVVRLRPDFAFGRLSLVKHLTNRGDFTEAESTCREALKIKPNMASGYAWLGIILARQTKYDEALRLLDDANRRFPDIAEIHFAIASVFALKGEHNRAIESYRKSIELRPNYAVVYADMRIVLGLAGRHAESVKAAREALRLRPDSAQLHVDLGYSLTDAELYDEALSAFREGLRLDPKLVGAHNMMGIVLDRQEKWNEAIEAYQKAIALEPKKAVYQANLASTYSHKRDYAAAIAAYQQAVSLEPKKVSYQRGLAIAQEESGDRKLAIETCKQAVELDRSDADSWNTLGNLYWRGGDSRRAVEAYQESVALCPDNATIQDNLGNALRVKGEPAEAEKVHREAIRLRPLDVSLHVNLGMDLKSQGKIDEAIAELRNAILLKNDYPGAHNQLGHTLELAGRLEEAERAFRNVAVLLPKEGWVYENIGRVCFRRRGLDEAVANLQRSVEIDSKSASAFSWLAPALRNLGRFEDALIAFQSWKGLAPHNKFAIDSLRQCERLRALDPRIDAIDSGQLKPESDEQRMDFALLCYYKRRYAAAVRYFGEIAAGRATDARNTDFLFIAAGAAMRASIDAKDDADRTRFRLQALDWLKAMLEQAAKFQIHGDEIGDWRFHPAFAGVREPAALANIPAAERLEWEKIWTEVAAVAKRPSP